VTLLLLALAAVGGLAHAAWEPSPDVAAPFNAGVLALNAADPAAAADAFRDALVADPSCGRCAHGLGLSLLRQERLDDARDALADALDRYPEHAELHTAYAAASFAAQDFDTARSHASTAVALAPTSIDAQVAYQQVLLRLGAIDDARAALDRATDLPGPERACLSLLIDIEQDRAPNSTSRAYCSQAGHPGLASTVDARIGAHASRPAVAAAAATAATSMQLVVQALQRHQAGDDPAALPLLDRALALEPRRVDARILRAVARARTGAMDDAIADLQLVLDAKSWVEVHRTGELSGVLTAGDEAELREGVRQGAGLLVSLLVEEGRLDDAERTLSRANSAYGMGPRLTAGAVRLRTAQGLLPAAWDILAHGLEQWPADSDLGLLATELAARDPDGVPAALADSVAGATDWRALYHRAHAAAEADRHAACAADAERSWQGLDTSDDTTSAASADDRATVLRLMHTCAVNAGLLTAADRAADALRHPGVLQPIARVNHALMREDVGDHEGALALLDGFQPPTDEARHLAANLTVYAAGELGRWEQALAAAPDADADVALWLGLRMRDAGRDDAALAVADRCAELNGDLAAGCNTL